MEGSEDRPPSNSLETESASVSGNHTYQSFNVSDLKSTESLAAMTHEGAPTGHQLPPDASLVDFMVFIPVAVYKFYKRLCIQFGWRYITMLTLVYGVQQGIGMAWVHIASYWFLLDNKPKGLGLKNTSYAIVRAFSEIAWHIKAMYGIVSDMYPINGRHHSPYIVVSSVLGMVSFGVLGLGYVRDTFTVAITLF
eukprot:5973107-Pyramimonas_sp.AAC.1